MKVVILTPDEMTAFLTAVDRDWLPFFAISAFTGLRSQEVSRLDWSEIKLNRSLIDLPVSTSPRMEIGNWRRFPRTYGDPDAVRSGRREGHAASRNSHTPWSTEPAMPGSSGNRTVSVIPSVRTPSRYGGWIGPRCKPTIRPKCCERTISKWSQKGCRTLLGDSPLTHRTRERSCAIKAGFPAWAGMILNGRTPAVSTTNVPRK